MKDCLLFCVFLSLKHYVSSHYTVNKNSGKKRQHPRESNHIHGIEQDKPRGMKNRGQNNELQ